MIAGVILTLANISSDRTARMLVVGTLIVLAAASLLGICLRWRVKIDESRRAVANLNARVRAWWMMAMVFGLAIYFGPLGASILFGLVSFLALREMLTLTPTRRADHHTLFWVFFVITPLQYYLIYLRWYGFFVIFIPVYCYIFLAIRGTLSGDYAHYLERTAKVQWSVFICVYCVSYVPALLMLDVPGHDHHPWELLVWLVVVVQMSDVFQYVWGKSLGRHRIAPHISPGKTWEGFLGGALCATLLAMAMCRMTPFSMARAASIGLVMVILGFFGGIVMSAIKRDAGVKDYGHLIAGHGGMMDRIDSLTFAAPVFFHIVRYWYV